jgi:hypothetical protein
MVAERSPTHLLGALTTLLAPLLEPQVDTGAADWEVLGHTTRPLSRITGFKGTAAQIRGIRFGHRASPLNLRFLNPPNLHAFRFNSGPSETQRFCGLRTLLFGVLETTVSSTTGDDPEGGFGR